MGFEPTTLRDHGGSWVQIPSGARFFSEFPFNDANIYLVVFLLDSLGGWMVASQICLNVTA